MTTREMWVFEMKQQKPQVAFYDRAAGNPPRGEQCAHGVDLPEYRREWWMGFMVDDLH